MVTELLSNNDSRYSLITHREAIAQKFSALSSQTERAVVKNDDHEHVYVSESIAVPLPVLPERIKKLTTIANPSLDEAININFGSFNGYGTLPPTYSFSVWWNRPHYREEAVINGFCVNINKTQPHRIKEFFPLDSRTAYLSDMHFPYSLNRPFQTIPFSDRKATFQHIIMNTLIIDSDFQMGIIEDFISVFTN